MSALCNDLNKLLAPFREMAMFDDCELVSPESPGACGDTPVHVAAFDNDVETLRSLMPFVKNINVRGELRFTPLHNAILHGSVESADYLISMGADLECENDLQENAVMMMAGRADFAYLMQRYGISDGHKAEG